MNTRIRIALAGALASLALPVIANAATFTFDVVQNGVWANANHWTRQGPGGGFPGSLDFAIIPAGRICRVEAQQAVMDLELGGELQVNQQDLTIGADAQDITVDVSGTLRLNAPANEARIKLRGHVIFLATSTAAKIIGQAPTTDCAEIVPARSLSQDLLEIRGPMTVLGSLGFYVHIEAASTTQGSPTFKVEAPEHNMVFGGQGTFINFLGYDSILFYASNDNSSSNGKITFRSVNLNSCVDCTVHVNGDGDADVGTVVFDTGCVANATSMRLVVTGGVVEVETMVHVDHLCFTRGKINVAPGQVFKADPPG